VAKFKQNNVELRDNQKILFDTSKTKWITYNGSEVGINTTLSGVDPTEDGHLVTKEYVDTVSGTLQTQIDEGGGGSSIFGSEYDYAESEGESSTTSDSYQQKLRLTTGTVPAGTYRIGWSFEYSSTEDKVDCGFRIELDDTTAINEIVPPPKKKYSDGAYDILSGFKHTSLTNASHIIDVDYKANIDAELGTTYIKNTRLEIWRVE